MESEIKNINNKTHYDVIVVGAGASGLMCALTAGQRGRRVLVLEKAKKVGKKILISGGGRCNFTNRVVRPENYISQNEHFCKSALSRFDNQDFLEYVHRYQIPYHERAQGRLFCDGTAREIVDVLLEECRLGNVSIHTECEITKVIPLNPSDHVHLSEARYQLETTLGVYTCASLVVATGGLSIPKMGASGWGHRLAKQFDLQVIPCKPGLTPFRWKKQHLEKLKILSGISTEACLEVGSQVFTEPMLFTHQGLSGPVSLQASNYWSHGDPLKVNLFPEEDLFSFLKRRKSSNPQMEIKTALAEKLPRRLVQSWLDAFGDNQVLQHCSQQKLQQIAEVFQDILIEPEGVVGYSVAEVTLGGVDTYELSSKTMEAKKAPGLYFIGEVVDVTGWLGGYNFQWAWASGYCSGLHV
jgi:predicted Rossmann fold flavoprotein